MLINDFILSIIRHTKQSIKKVYDDKDYFGKPSRGFLSMYSMDDGIMINNTTRAALTSYAKERKSEISKVRYIVEQYFGFSHLHGGQNKLGSLVHLEINLIAGIAR